MSTDPRPAALAATLTLCACSSVLLSGCDRLNPDWCAEHATCGPGEYCDPASNSCRPREAGMATEAAPTDAVLNDAATDQPGSLDAPLDDQNPGDTASDDQGGPDATLDTSHPVDLPATPGS